MTEESKPKEDPPHPMMADEYGCLDCEYTWRGDEMDCPVCGSTKTGLLIPADKDMH